MSRVVVNEIEKLKEKILNNKVEKEINEQRTQKQQVILKSLFLGKINKNKQTTRKLGEITKYTK